MAQIIPVRVRFIMLGTDLALLMNALRRLWFGFLLYPIQAGSRQVYSGNKCSKSVLMASESSR